MSEGSRPTPPAALVVASVETGSPASRAGISAGDLLREVDGSPVQDVLDYRFRVASEAPVVAVERGEERVTVTLDLSDGEDPGLSFTEDLADAIHTCNNKCVFCFIHQMPKRMRRSLYLMDDDFRLSFIHGNYITLTNVSEAEWRRILEQRLSPLYVSVHATEPELRGRMLGKREPAPVLPQLRTLAEGRIDVHAQVVLCPGWNDGAALEQTLSELAAEHPSRSGRRRGVLSVAIVPVGLTHFREPLTPLDRAGADYAGRMIRAMRARQRAFQQDLGTRFAWLSDEWYYLAGVSVPGSAHYEDFPQLEDGVGTSRLFLEDARRVARRLPDTAAAPVRATLVTSQLPAQLVEGYAERLCRTTGVAVNVCVVENRFFGPGINIAGLLTGQDIAAAIISLGAHPTVVVPSICLRDEMLFLDDWTIADLERATGRTVLVSGKRPSDLAALLGLVGMRRSLAGAGVA